MATLAWKAAKAKVAPSGSELPLACTAQLPEGCTYTRAAEAAPTGPRLAGGHYLIVDDNALNLDVLQRYVGDRRRARRRCCRFRL